MDNSNSTTISKISHIHSLCKSYLQSELSKKGLPDLASSHGYILFLLSREKNLSMQEISKKINRDKSTTTVLVKKLEKLNLVESTPSPSDSRSKLINLTAQGKEYRKQTQEVSDSLKERFSKNLTPEEINSLESTLNKIAENFSDYQ